MKPHALQLNTKRRNDRKEKIIFLIQVRRLSTTSKAIRESERSVNSRTEREPFWTNGISLPLE